MFFPERIRNIQPSDRVLEIGPGSDPHPRSNVLLEKIFDENEAAEQRGHTPDLETDKKVIYYEGGRFPFKDKEFDYVICSHVLEHVGDVDEFVAELTRVAGKGYLEYPSVYYEYLYNFKVHLNLLHKKDDTLYWIRKSDTRLNDFYEIQICFYRSLAAGHTDLIDANKHIFFEGYEWSGDIATRQVSDLSLVCANRDELTFGPVRKAQLWGMAKAKRYITKLRNMMCSSI